jgi:predicted outer membrane repeat protein
MKLKNLLIFLIILTVLINISCIYATDNNTEILGENNGLNIYVDANTGDDSNTGYSWETPLKSIGKAIDLTDNNKTTNIYLGNGTYTGENNVELIIENKNTVNIIGSDNTIIDGENLKQILTLSNIRDLTLKNIQFVNATSKNVNYGVAITVKNNTNVLIDSCQFLDNTKSSIYNEGTLTITNTYFFNNKDRSSDSINSILGGAIYNTDNLAIANSTFKENYAGSGGAIYNTGNLTVDSSTFRYNKATNHGGSMIVDSIKNRKDGGRGGDICNFGTATITNTTFKETQLVDLGARGGSIYNNGTMLLKEVEISNIAMISDDQIGRHTAGTAIANIGNLTLKDSIIANITTHVTYQGRIQGAIQNEGLFQATGTLFVNNKPDKVYGHQIYYDVGTGNIYNTGVGILNITSCAFFNENRNFPSTVAQDVAIIEGSAVCLENNSWGGENPLKNNHIYGTLNITKYWLLSLEPDYSMLEIGGKVNITETMKLMNEKHKVDYGQLPDLYVTFNVNGENITKKLVDGEASVEFNQSDIKGSYVVTSTMFNIVKTADVDVGKEYSAMEVEAEEICYGDDAKFYMIVTGNYTHQPTGNITVIIGENKYTTRITDTKASVTVSDLIPNTYDLIIRYEGDEDYFKSIFHHNYTVHKKPTHMNITIPEINYGETGIITVSLTPEDVATQAYMYITDENNQTTKKTVFVKNGTELKLKNYAGGEYNITIVLWDHKYYASSNASAIFKVKKFATNLTINSTDINAGETEILNITLLPKGEVAGEANLTINNHTQTIFLKNGENQVTIENLGGGTYNITVTFPGDKKYAASTATTTFSVMKLQSNITAKIENNILYINTTPNTTGLVLIYINDDIYEVNLTNSQIVFPINFTKAENNIFIYYQGDRYYNYSMTNLTYEYEELINLTVYDSTFYNTENATVYITLTDEEGYGIPDRTVTITLNKKTYTKVTENDGSITLKPNLPVGTYEITAQYMNKRASNIITILEDAFLNGSDIKIYENTDFTYTIILTDHNKNPIKNAKITFKINNNTYTNKTDKNGKASLNLNLNRGEYSITASYRTINITNTITVVDLILTGNDITYYNTESGTYIVTLTNDQGKGVSGKKITIKLQNKTYTRTTDKNGTAALSINNLDTGNYTITATYNKQTITNKITVLEDRFLNTNDIRTYENVDFIYTAILTDHNGKGVADAKITFNINGKTYKNTTNTEGAATITLNLKQGNYTITTSYKKINNTNSIFIADLILNGNDLTYYNTENATYTVILTNDQGKGVSGKKITIKLQNKTYTRTTNKNGIATLSINNLDTGNYTITATYTNQTITNKITVLEDRFLDTNNTKAYENVDFTHIAKLTDHNGKGVANAEITFIFENKTYKNTTNSKGIATLKLNLKEGNYTITTTYKKITNKNKIIIVDDSHLVGNDVKAYSGTDFTYKTKLTDHNNKPIKNAKITYTIGNKTYTNKTNSKGESTLTFNLETGNYTITATYKNRTIENNFEIIEDYILSGNDVKTYSETNFPYRVNLTDHNGKVIKNAEITFKVNGKTYTNKTDVNGQAIINLNLKTGTYTITAKYRNTTTTNTLTIIEDYILSGNDIKAYADDDFIYKVNLTNHNGKAIKNTAITLEVDGKIYTNKTNSQGQATITLNLKEGNYTITATYKNTTTTNGLEIIENHVLTGQNVKAYENTDFTYTATLKRTDGTPIPDKEITFIINNRRYTDTTDKDGKASKTLNLPEGNYTITAIYKNTRITNNLTIIEEYNLEANNIRAYADDNFQYKVNLTDHNRIAIKNAEITFEINGETYKNKTDNQGQARITLNLKEGNYTITASYRNNKITNKLEIIETYTLKGMNVKSYENFDFEYIVTLKNHNDKAIENAEITFEINGETYKNKTDSQGQARITLNLKEGNYTITAKYKNITTTNKLNIIKYDLVKIESSDLVMYYKDGSRFTIRLTENSTALTNKTVEFTINGNTYKRTTNDEGYASIAINLNSGNHTITSRYQEEEVTNNIYIKTTVEGKDVVKVYRNATQYYAKFVDNKGNPLKNTDVNFNINGVYYTRTTDESGVARLNLNLQQGTYILTAMNPKTGENAANNITILSTITENNDLTKYYRNESQYTVKIIKQNGKVAGAGEKVTFNINGVFYERYTNESGIAKMNINLQPGDYIITAEYNGCKVSNKIKVLPTLKAKDLTKKYGEAKAFEATLLDGTGKPLANEKVTFNINGVFYERTTNEAGIAKLNINLQPGKYTITSSYNGANIANKVTIQA